MKKSVLALATVTAMLTGASAFADDSTPKLVTVLTASEPQTQLMAMVLTMQSIQKGADAHVLLCGSAGDMALKEAPASVTEPQKPKGMSPQGLMGKIMQTGAKVEVCAIYLPNKGVAPDALMDGITPAKPPEMAAKLLADDTRIMSF